MKQNCINIVDFIAKKNIRRNMMDWNIHNTLKKKKIMQSTQEKSKSKELRRRKGSDNFCSTYSSAIFCEYVRKNGVPFFFLGGGVYAVNEYTFAQYVDYIILLCFIFIDNQHYHQLFVIISSPIHIPIDFCFWRRFFISTFSKVSLMKK